MDQEINKLLAAKYSLTGPGIVPNTNGSGSASQLESIISNVLGVLTIVAVIFFVFQIIFAGYSFLSSQGDSDKIKSARTRLTNGILGLTIVVVAFGAGAFIANLLGLEYVFNLEKFINSIAPATRSY